MEREGRQLLAANIRRYRIKRGLTQKQLAERCDLRQSEISAVERGIRSPTASTFIRLCGGLSITSTEMFDGITWDPMTRRYEQPRPRTDATVEPERGDS